MSLTNDLNCRVTIWARQSTDTAYGDTDLVHAPLCEVWAQIRPHGGLGRATGGNVTPMPGEMQEPYLRHSIIIRANALPSVTTDMYVTYQGRRYNVDFWRPHYQRNDRVELICTMVMGDEQPPAIPDPDFGGDPPWQMDLT